MADTLRAHNVVLRDGRLVLRPLTERDWPCLLRWNRDPDVLRWVEANDAVYDLAMLQRVYRGVSQTACCFIIKFEGRDVGECWLQRMNLPRILARYPGTDCRRIDIMVGEPRCWGRGIGTRAIGLLVRFAFGREGAGALFACDVRADNERSLRAFGANGFRPVETGAPPACIDLLLTRAAYEAGLAAR